MVYKWLHHPTKEPRPTLVNQAILFVLHEIPPNDHSERFREYKYRREIGRWNHSSIINHFVANSDTVLGEVGLRGSHLETAPLAVGRRGSGVAPPDHFIPNHLKSIEHEGEWPIDERSVAGEDVVP
jgi:hypothetical protein